MVVLAVRLNLNYCYLLHLSLYILYTVYILNHIKYEGWLRSSQADKRQTERKKKSPPDTASSTVQMFELGSARLTSALFAAKKTTQMTSWSSMIIMILQYITWSYLHALSTWRASLNSLPPSSLAPACWSTRQSAGESPLFLLCQQLLQDSTQRYKYAYCIILHTLFNAATCHYVSHYVYTKGRSRNQCLTVVIHQSRFVPLGIDTWHRMPRMPRDVDCDILW